MNQTTRGPSDAFSRPLIGTNATASLALPQADHVARPQVVPRCTAARFWDTRL